MKKESINTTEFMQRFKCMDLEPNVIQHTDIRLNEDRKYSFRDGYALDHKQLVVGDLKDYFRTVDFN